VEVRGDAEMSIYGDIMDEFKVEIAQLKAENAALRKYKDKLETVRPLSVWHEDFGCVLWHRMPICEPPYCGTPDASDWPYEDDDETLFWSPLPDSNAIRDRYDAAREGN